MCRLRLNRPETLFIKHPQYSIQLPPAFDDEASACNHAELALLISKRWRLLYSVERLFAGPAEDREDGSVGFEIQRIVFPMSGADHLAIDIEDSG